jgi:preprotein translocase subunit SecD
MLNMLLLLGAMAAFKATLTLPGIAGIVLTIGMAVDANVLIFERTKEELRMGKTPRAAVEAGYEKAFLTILDSNITTLVAALFLFQFGTGPVKGFAVTLTIGIIVSIFTAVFVTRIFFDYFVWNRKIKSLSI